MYVATGDAPKLTVATYTSLLQNAPAGHHNPQFAMWLAIT